MAYRINTTTIPDDVAECRRRAIYQQQQGAAWFYLSERALALIMRCTIKPHVTIRKATEIEAVHCQQRAAECYKLARLYMGIGDDDA